MVRLLTARHLQQAFNVWAMRFDADSVSASSRCLVWNWGGC